MMKFVLNGPLFKHNLQASYEVKDTRSLQYFRKLNLTNGKGKSLDYHLDVTRKKL